MRTVLFAELDFAAVINRLPGVFVDPGYRYSVRAYRYTRKRTVALHSAEVEDLLDRYQFNKLTFTSTSADTYIVQKGTDKGEGLRAVKRYLGCEGEPTVVIGDSDQDISMIEAAEFAYAPANCTKKVRELANRNKLKIMSRPGQKGLLAAARDVVRTHTGTDNRHLAEPSFSKGRDDLMFTLLRVAESSRPRQICAAFNWRCLTC